MVILPSLPVSAQSVLPTFVWDDERGFTALDSACVPSNSLRIDFFSTIHPGEGEYEAFYGPDGKVLAQMPDGTLFKFLDGGKVDLPNASLYKQIRIVGVPGQYPAAAGSSLPQKSAKGFVARAAVQELKYFKIILTQDIDGQISNVGDTPMPLLGSHWLPEFAEGAGYSIYTCGSGGSKAVYTVFQVHGPSDVRLMSPAARVLVHRDHTRIFQNIQVYQKASAPRPLTVVTAPVVEVATAPVVDVVFPRRRPEKFNETPVTLTPAVQASSGQSSTFSFSGDLVVCIGDPTMKAHGDPAKDATFDKVFDAIRFEPLKPVINAANNVKKKTVGGKDYEFGEFEFPNHTKDGEKSGWLALKFIKDRSACEGYSKESYEKAVAEASKKPSQPSEVKPVTNSSKALRNQDVPLGRCAKMVMDADGTMGKYGQTLFDTMNRKAYRDYFLKSNSLTCVCSNFASMNDSEKLTAWVYAFTAVASLEAGGTKGYKDKTYCSPSVKHTISPVLGAGMWAMEVEFRYREGRGPDCYKRGEDRWSPDKTVNSSFTDGDLQATCAVSTVVDTILEESPRGGKTREAFGRGSVCSNPGPYSTINDYAKLKKVMKAYKPCGN